MLGFKKKTEVPVVQSVQPSVAIKNEPVHVNSLLRDLLLKYDGGLSFGVNKWIIDNIEDSDVEPDVEICDKAVISYSDTINRVSTTVSNKDLPNDFVNVNESTSNSGMEVTIL